jgi:hypothetical protein
MYMQLVADSVVHEIDNKMYGMIRDTTVDEHRFPLITRVPGMALKTPLDLNKGNSWHAQTSKGFVEDFR